ncbi:MAG: protein-L-isoaspartate(D-aspartate) O-methyltransferase [Chloroflexi bacterium]|nr:protein-L-isoaspartate(D-aspartate) O-methyltransferase [Chloroflexota bacterium]
MAVDFAAARFQLIQHLRREIKDERVLKAMERVPREFFVPPASRHLAYEDIPLPIGEGQTISQPFMVAYMTEALNLKGTERVLEIGAGSGYQTAILAELAHWVVSAERLAHLAETARDRLRELGYRNVEVHLAGKTLGWKEGAPYDAIMVTAGAPLIPQTLLEQLKDGGCMVIPVGSRYDQMLTRVEKHGDHIITKDLGGCRFVPLIGEEAWSEA